MQSKRLKILFIHQNYPAQFGHFAEYLSRNGWEVHFANANQKAVKPAGSNVQIHHFRARREVGEKTHHYLKSSEAAVLNAQALVRLGMTLKKKGFEPDIVMFHSGWGSGSLAQAVWPKAKFIQYLEWWYNFPPWDLSAPIDESDKLEKHSKTIFKNVPSLLDWSLADLTIVPTEFQASALPKKLQHGVEVLADGVDTKFFAKDRCEVDLRKRLNIPSDAKLVTFASRGMEPQRGFPQFMRLWEQLSSTDKNVHCIIAAEDNIHYGAKLPDGDSYKKRMLDELELDLSRTHFVGHLASEEYRDLLCLSDCHVYYTLPFVLSWSLLDAMSCGAPILSAENTAVQEFITDKKSGLLGDMNDTGQMVKLARQILDDKNLAQALGATARQEVEKNYARNKIFPMKEKRFRSLIK